MPRFAAFIAPRRSLHRAAQRASVAETLGYELALTNHIANRDGLFSLAALGQTTSRIRLGTGVYPAFIQTPVSLAQQAATLDEIVDGRLVLGLGTSHRPVIEGWHGLEFPEEPLTAMREIVAALRSLFGEGSLQADGDHVTADFRFQGLEPRPDIPIHLAALSPGMLRLAGEIADGVILWMTDPGYVRETVVPSVAEGAERAGRDPSEIEVIAAVPSALVEDDAAPVRSRFRRSIAPYLSLPFYRRMLDRAGFGADLERFDAGMSDGDPDRALDGVSDEMIDRLAGIGDAETVRAKVEEYRQAGSSLPAVSPLVSDGTASFEQLLAAAIGREVGSGA